MTEYGIWSEATGGFIETQIYEYGTAVLAQYQWVGQGEEWGDLSTLAICPNHEEQPADSCEECEEES